LNPPGDVKIHSWFEEIHDSRLTANPPLSDSTDEWCRVLSLDLNGFRGGFAKGAKSLGESRLSSMTEPIDLEIVLRKPTLQGREMTIRGALSFVEVTLQYTDYLVLRAVARDNIGRKIETNKWDNVEKAYWLEEESANNDLESNDIFDIKTSTENQVAYSSNARFVRYGKGRKHGQQITPNDTLAPSQSFASSTDGTQKGGNSLDLKFKLGGLSLKLRRDDSVEGVHESDSLAEAFHYDVMLLRVQLVEISLTANGKGDISFHLSLFRIGLFDLGDRGRLIRKNYYACLPLGQPPSPKSKPKLPRQPCPFYVLAEGYAADKNLNSSNEAEDAPQFVVTVDRCPASSAGAIGSLAESELPDESKVTVARVVINYLTLNALIRPFKEIGGFLSCEWPSSYGQPCIKPAEPDHPGTTASSTKYNQTNEKALGHGFQVKLVAHYPRIFFLADECDPHTRALVLRG
jgi:hypothetical protein